MELNINEEITRKGQNQSFLSNKYIFQTLYQALQTTTINFEDLLG